MARPGSTRFCHGRCCRAARARRRRPVLPPIFRSVTAGGGATRPARRRFQSRRQSVAPNTATSTSMVIQPASGLMLALAMLLIVSSWIGIVPPSPRIFRRTPCQKRRPASVTTKEGRPILVMIVPCSTPMPAQARSAAGIAAYQGQPWAGLARSAMITPPRPATNPTERSISPRSRTKTCPIASRLKTAAWTSRLTRLPAVRKFESRDWNRIEIRIIPAMTGRTPLSPALTLASEVRRYSPTEPAAISAGTASSAWRAASSVWASASGGSTGSSTLAIRPFLLSPSSSCRAAPRPRSSSGRPRSAGRARLRAEAQPRGPGRAR